MSSFRSLPQAYAYSESNGITTTAKLLYHRFAPLLAAWLPKPVPEELLRQLYETLKWGSTSANISPARFLFIRSKAAKEHPRPSLAPGNVEKTMAAPATIVITNGLKFYDKLPWLFPHYPAMRDMFVNNPQLIQKTAAELYLSKSLHDTCGAGFGTGLRGDVSFCNAKLDEEFFAAGKCESCEREFPLNHVKSNFLCNIGYGDPAKVMPRGRRLDFSEACNLS